MSSQLFSSSYTVLKPSTQAKVFGVVFGVCFTAEFFCELLLFNTIPKNHTTLKVRFWTRYVIHTACAAMVGLSGYMLINMLAHAKWNTLAWALAILPTCGVMLLGLLMQGVSTTLYNTSGLNCTDLVLASIREGRKRKMSGINDQEQKRLLSRVAVETSGNKKMRN